MISSASQAATIEAPETVMSKDEYWQSIKGDAYAGSATKAPAHYNDLNYKIAKFFGHGAENKFEADYEAYLNNVNNRNEARATQSARSYDEYMSNTAYSRAFEDLENAGINPYMIVNSGSSPATTVGSSSKASYAAKSTQETKSNNKGRDLALIMLAIARLAAAL